MTPNISSVLQDRLTQSWLASCAIRCRTVNLVIEAQLDSKLVRRLNKAVHKFFQLIVFVITVVVPFTTNAVAEARCAEGPVHQWIQGWENVVAAGGTPDRLQRAVKEAREAATYPNLYASQCEPRLVELSAAATEFRRQGAPGFRVFLGAVLTLVVVIVLAFLVLSFLADKPPADPEARRKGLKRELNELRLENDVVWEKARTRLLSVKIESKGAGLFKVRDERLLDALLTRQALNQVLNGGQRTIEGNPLVSAIAALSQEIESRTADGLDTTEMQDVVRRLQSARAPE